MSTKNYNFGKINSEITTLSIEPYDHITQHNLKQKERKVVSEQMKEYGQEQGKASLNELKEWDHICNYF
ncbi:MAG: hypothetical protein ACI8Y7_001137 [Candidatus Woesearchaeota archaeon]|jgi:hypothetical protein